MSDYFKSFIGASLRSVEKKDYSWFFIFGDLLRLETESSWRFITPEGIIITSEDHGQKFGLPLPVDAVECVTTRLSSHLIQAVSCDPKTGDLSVFFSDTLYLQLLQMSSGYESWRAITKDGMSICMGGGEIEYFAAT